MKNKGNGVPSPFSVIVITLALSLSGAFSLKGLSVGQNMSIRQNTLSIWFSNPSLSARSIERDITSRVESMVSTVDGTEGCQSSSSDGFGSVTVSLKDGTDIAQARFISWLKLRQLRPHLPQGTTIELNGDVSGGETPAIMTWSVLSTLPVEERDSVSRSFLAEHLVDVQGISQILYQGHHPDHALFSRVNGMDCGQFVIYPTAKANVVRVCRKVRRIIQENIDRLPPGIHMECTSDSGEEIMNEIARSVSRSAASLLILAIALVLIYRDRKLVCIILSSLSADILITLLCCRILGIGIDIGTLSALTIVMGMLIDASIVMAQGYPTSHSRRAAVAVLTAVLTTVASLLLVFMLPEEQRRNLEGFVWTTAISLTVSFLMAWLTVPAMIEQWGITTSDSRTTIDRLRRFLSYQRLFMSFILQTVRFRSLVIGAFSLLTVASGLFCFRTIHAVGIKSDSANDGNMTIQADIESGRPTWYIDDALTAMEHRVALFPQIERFHTNGYGAHGNIGIKFSSGIETSVKTEIRDSLWFYAMRIPTVAWTFPSAMEGQESYSTYFTKRDWGENITLLGYDYDLLMRYANMLLDSLNNRSRVRDAGISTDRSLRSDSEIYSFRIDRRKAALMGVDRQGLKWGLADMDLMSDAGLWIARNYPIPSNGNQARISNLGDLVQTPVSSTIIKENQEYVVHVGYNYIGDELGHYLMRSTLLENISQILPMGFRLGSSRWDSIMENRHNTLLLIGTIFLIIFLICCAMFNSTRIALAAISLIPVSISGIFILYGVLHVQPDQSCLAAIVMTGGLSVNSAIYIATEYVQSDCRGDSGARLARAFLSKSAPTALTILSTSLGLLPFLFTDEPYGFWFMLCSGVIAGLTASGLGLTLLFPAVIISKKRINGVVNSEKGNNFTRS